MDRQSTNQEWADKLRPLLAMSHKPSARRKLCRLHKNGPVSARENTATSLLTAMR